MEFCYENECEVGQLYHELDGDNGWYLATESGLQLLTDEEATAMFEMQEALAGNERLH